MMISLFLVPEKIIKVVERCLTLPTRIRTTIVLINFEKIGPLFTPYHECYVYFFHNVGSKVILFHKVAFVPFHLFVQDQSDLPQLGK